MQNPRIVLFPLSPSSQEIPVFCKHALETLCGGELKHQYQLGPYESPEACLEDIPQHAILERADRPEIIVAFLETIPFPPMVLKLRRKIEAEMPTLLANTTWIVFAREMESGLDTVLSRLGYYWTDYRSFPAIWRADKTAPDEADKPVMDFLIVPEQLGGFDSEELLARAQRLRVAKTVPPRVPSPMKRSGSSTTIRITRSEPAIPSMADDSHDPRSK
ncbi:MAG: hypothetical protein WC787_00600 [Patescibacteria group bacterium]|jgi:hypothetical protein